MSLSLRIGLIFTIIIVLTVLVASANWIGTMYSIRRQSEILAFSEDLKQNFNQLASEEKTFSITPLPVHSQKVFSIIESINFKIQSEKNILSHDVTSASLDDVLLNLNLYEDTFKNYSENLVELYTIKSRLVHDLEKIVFVVKSFPNTPLRLSRYIALSLLDIMENHVVLYNNTFPYLSTYSALKTTVDHLLNFISSQETTPANTVNSLHMYKIRKALQTYLSTSNQLFIIQKDVYESSNSRVEQLSLLRDKIDNYIDTENSRVAERSKLYLQFALFITLFAAILSVSATVLLSRIIVRPIERLKNSALDIVNGNLNTSVHVDRNDEIGQLSLIFNKMALNLSESFSKLEQYKNHLESLVEDRTAELRHKIAEKELAEQSLIASQNNIQRIIDQIPVGIVLWDKDFFVRQMNPASQKIFGYIQEEVEGKHATFFCSEESKNLINEMFMNLTRKKSEIRQNIHNKVKDHTIILCDWFNTPFLDSSGKINGFISIIEDITAKNRNEKELLKMAKLQSAGLLAGGIAHDFNNILTGILGTINLSLLDNNLTPKTRSLLISSEKACLRSKSLTQQLLTFAKGGDPVKETTALRETIIDSATFALHGGNITVEFNIDEDIFPVDIDKGQFSQVIQNIIINSRHAMPDGGKISISCSNVEEIIEHSVNKNSQPCIKISISDKGIGISEEMQEKIFDPYFSTKQEGSGLGLAITHSIVVKHGGKITVESQLGSGTTFHIFLPVSQTPAYIQKKAERHTFKTRPWKILVMDDEEMVLTVIQNMLERQGHTVITSRNSKDCLHLFSSSKDKNPFDLVILDLTIPGEKGGKETACDLLAIDPKTKIIVTSGYSNDPTMSSFRTHGFVANLSKPFTSMEVFKTISDVQNEFYKYQ